MQPEPPYKVRLRLPAPTSKKIGFGAALKVAAPAPQHCFYIQIKLIKKHLKFHQKEELTNYLQFSISFYSSAVHTVQNS